VNNSARDRVIVMTQQQTVAVTGAARHPFVEKLNRYTVLCNEEQATLSSLLARTRTIHRGRDIVVQGRPHQALQVLNDGLALRYKILADGKRQILNLVVPGDLIGLPACMFESAIATVSSLTDISVSTIEYKDLFALFHRHPRVAIALFWTSAREGGVYIERLTTIGRRTAYERLAHLILELLFRLRAVGLAGPASFEMPLTQEMLGDMLGLSLQHVNRMIRNLREEGLASVEVHKVTIHDMDALVRLAGFEEIYLSQARIPGLA
jgi:CRP-like cAMP-binding protein